MIPRALQTRLRKAARGYPVVTLTGPRQSGKTTLVRATFPRHEYVSLENPDEQAFARGDPRGFLARFSGGVVLDEAQRVPDLFSYIQTIVDGEDAPGRFVLSGSKNFLLLKSISQSLAGRSAVLHLLPFSLSELEGRSGLNLDALGSRVPPKARGSDRTLAETLFTGFYPRIHDKGLDPTDWLANYYATYVDRDVRDIVNVGDLEAFGRFVRLVAGRAGQLLNLSSLANDAGITHTTARRWLSILEASFLIVLLRPHYRNFNKRLVKSPKLYFVDSGLLCYLLRIRSPRDLEAHAARGPVFESFVVAELFKAATNAPTRPDLSFWRDSAGHEIDLVVETAGGSVPLEAKSGLTVPEDAFRGIEYWRHLAGDPQAPAVLVHGGKESYRRLGTLVLSWSAL